MDTDAPPAAAGGKLWLFGGGNGGDLVREGNDLRDVWTLDLRGPEPLAWARVAMGPAGSWGVRPTPTCLGRCHAGVLVGSKWVLFGGSLHMSNEVAWLARARVTRVTDPRFRAWRRLTRPAMPMCARRTSPR